MIKLGRITMHRFTEALEPFGIRPRQLAALIELRDHGELTQQSLCGQLHLDPTNLVAILNELEQDGYATRRRDPEDRRRHLVEVSNKGIAVIEKVSEVMDGVEDDLLEGFEPGEREQLETLLTRSGSERRLRGVVPGPGDRRRRRILEPANGAGRPPILPLRRQARRP